jgi:predicted short-subunit dehydrogenase-like oxidoreductase (DUF2520 family)
MILPSIETVVIIGSGNVATHFARTIKLSGKKIIQIYSKHPNSAKQLSQETDSTFVKSISEISKEADLYILAINDNAIEEVASSIKINNKLIIHTSGTVHAEILKKTSSNFGVIYPLQTFSKDIPIDWKNVPIFIEANNAINENILFNFVKSFANNINIMSSEKREILHLSAVFVNNFVNYMYNIAEDIMKQNKISFEYLKPLILETANRIIKNDPCNIQTGPAKRGDLKTIQKHLDLLSKQKDFADIYDFLTNMIIKKYEIKQNNSKNG